MSIINGDLPNRYLDGMSAAVICDTSLYASDFNQFQLSSSSNLKNHLHWGYTDGLVMQPIYHPYKDTKEPRSKRNHWVSRLKKKHSFITFTFLFYYFFEWLVKLLVVDHKDSDFIAMVMPPA